MKKSIYLIGPVLVCMFAFLVVSCGERYLSTGSYMRVEQEFSKFEYNLDKVRVNKTVPRLFYESMPENISEIKDVKKKKDLFIKIVLPLVLHVNERIAEDRRVILSIEKEYNKKGKLSSKSKKILKEMKEKYSTPEEAGFDVLLRRADEVPVSMALAQAIIESGWGTSRFALEGNALYGERTWCGEGIVPLGIEEGQNFKVRSFASLHDSVKSYIDNLNENKPYYSFRVARQAKRLKGKTLSGYDASGYMGKYSEINGKYSTRLKSIIKQNNLSDFDDAKLSPNQ